MDEPLNIYEDPRFEAILADLDAIARDLVREGKLRPITGLEEGELEIEFADYVDGDDIEPAIIASITSPRNFDGDERLLDDFEEELLRRLEAASGSWSVEATELLGDNRPLILLINDEEW